MGVGVREERVHLPRHAVRVAHPELVGLRIAAGHALLGVGLESISEAVERYRRILGAEPAKLRADYAKFELADPPLVLSLNLGGKPGTVGHLGIRRPDSAAVSTSASASTVYISHGIPSSSRTQNLSAFA